MTTFFLQLWSKVSVKMLMFPEISMAYQMKAHLQSFNCYKNKLSILIRTRGQNAITLKSTEKGRKVFIFNFKMQLQNEWILTYHHNRENEQQGQNTLSSLQASLSYLGTTQLMIAGTTDSWWSLETMPCSPPDDSESNDVQISWT